MTPRAVIAAVVLALVAASPARAETTTFRGVTDAGRTVTLDAATDGQATQLSVLWRPRCPARVRFGVQRTTFVPSNGIASAEAVLGTASYRLALPGGRVAKVSLRVTGALHGSEPATQRWSGGLRARVAIRRLGRAAGTCRLSTRWRAGREGVGSGTLTMASEQGDWLGGGQPWRYDAGNATFSAKGTPHVVTLHVEGQDHRDWDASFTAPSLNVLRAGQRYVTDAAIAGAASFDVRGDGRSCDATPGSFTVRAIRFDSLRRLSMLRLDYEMHCDNGTAANRGSLDWRAAG